MIARGASQGMVEGLNEQLSPTCTSKQQEIKPVEPLPPPQATPETKPQPESLLKGCAPQQVLPDHLGERMSNLIQGSAEVSLKGMRKRPSASMRLHARRNVTNLSPCSASVAYCDRGDQCSHHTPGYPQH